MADAVKHPAKFSPEVMDAIGDITRRRVTRGRRVLDGFAGTGRIHRLGESWGWDTTGIEIEPEWANMDPRTIVGDATRLPFPDRSFWAYITSPCYGNRMADHHDAKEKCKACDGGGTVQVVHEGRRPKVTTETCSKCWGKGYRAYKRNTYKHTLDRKRSDGIVDDLHPRNTGAMQWGPNYRAMHALAWAEATRVTSHWLILNISDHYRKGDLVPVTAWHVERLELMGWTEKERIEVRTQRNREGANGDLRAEFESVIAFRR